MFEPHLARKSVCMNRLGLASLFTALAISTGFAADAPLVRLHSAGSLRAAMTDVAAAYEAEYGTSVQMVYGASGALGDRLAKGEAGDVFASADMGYPEALAKAGCLRPHGALRAQSFMRDSAARSPGDAKDCSRHIAEAGYQNRNLVSG